MIEVKDEILAGEPRYRIVDENRNIILDNVSIEMTTQVIQEGTPLNKPFFELVKQAIADAKTNLDVFSAPPQNPINGQLYCDSYLNDVFIYIDGQWKSVFFNYEEFTQDILPVTGWAGDRISISASNDYGIWRISNNKNVSDTNMAKICDDDVDTSASASFESDADTFDVVIESPKRIKATTFRIANYNIKNGYIYGYDDATGTWDVLTDMFANTLADNYDSNVLNCLSDKYYTKFKISVGRYSADETQGRLYEFEIREGTIMIPKN